MLPRYMMIRYEDLVGDRDITLERLCKYLRIDPTDLDLKVLDRRLHGEGPDGGPPRAHISRWSLTEAERAILTKPGIRDVSTELGNEQDFEQDRAMIVFA